MTEPSTSTFGTPAGPAALDATQRRLLELLAQGSTVLEAAEQLGLSPRTAHRRLADARGALGVATNAEAIVLVLRLPPAGVPAPPA